MGEGLCFPLCVVIGTRGFEGRNPSPNLSGIGLSLQRHTHLVGDPCPLVKVAAEHERPDPEGKANECHASRVTPRVSL